MKYIIDIPDEKTYAYINDEKTFLRMPISLGENEIKSMFAPTMLRIKPYIEPDRKAIEDEVWKLASKLIWTITERECKQIFGMEAVYVPRDMPYSEAKSKYEAWKKQKEEIHVGDEVIYNGDRVVVTDIFLQDITRLWIEGVTSSGKTVEALESDIKKTGRHFAEIEELLKKLGGE